MVYILITIPEPVDGVYALEDMRDSIHTRYKCMYVYVVIYILAHSYKTFGVFSPVSRITFNELKV